MQLLGVLLGLICIAVMVAFGALVGDYYNSYVIAATIPVLICTIIGLACKD